MLSIATYPTFLTGLDTHFFLSNPKTASVILVPKYTDPNEHSNYRPISNIKFLSKYQRVKVNDQYFPIRFLYAS